MRINIAIDGPSASGKSTIAKLLAKRLGYTHIDTGAMYRGCAYKAYTLGYTLQDEDKICEMLKHTKFAFDPMGHLLLDGVDVTEEIRRKEMDILSSSVSALPKIRIELVRRQQEMAKSKGFIMDGRDIGTVVLRDAEVKIFQTASSHSRAQRRFSENLKKNRNGSYDEILSDLQLRDHQDTHREHSPLRVADDAVVIDTSDLTNEEVVACIEKIVTNKIKEMEGDRI
ncbi:MAG: (d)CMP kinase [Erysipelotrichales bacterium]|nr:MAG: (d)CMP kinase [Erysipelotrichales bacterium]